MAKRISLNAFDMTCVDHQSFGLWRHPRSRATEYNTIEYWTHLAQVLERGRFDALFLADVVGIYDIYRNSAAPSIADGAQVPVNDPFMQISAMAAVTKNLGFGVTSAVTYEQPYTLARKYATLDHLTRGRVGFNVVTSYLPSAAENQGLPTQIEHDERYEIAEEFLDVCYKLWEGSWEDDAVVKDVERGIYADPAKVHPIQHRGKHFTVPGAALTEPSPQRTPLIFQAGASSRGQAFAGKHAEAVFIGALRPDLTRYMTDRIRDKVEAEGRDRDDVKIYAMLSVVVDETDEKAQAKYREYQSYANLEASQAIIGGWSGLDLSKFQEDEVLNYVKTEAIQSFLTPFTMQDGDKQWTREEIARHCAIGGMGDVVVGSPQTVADQLETWIDEGGLDGINLAYHVSPGSFEDFVEQVVPELQKRGRYRADYDGPTLRENVYGAGQTKVLDTHPAAKYRGAYVGRPSTADTPARDLSQG
ncbi:LLM class flavin-dependent oxidoreductase [Kocuria sp. p3-SID1433]|uniref:LLM class flavin-dependent oxidoreductase n=1 Tax=unclassified Kocuria TaxID=2649579 RepID=UPI0021A8555E|nr:MULTISPECIES: LLM class flavin-dependent oxidoreductase [unclassified Kocuria]MCT1602569.1 LLM class flavin-dependent oxidoreductase [Kocuria sp. p3-SID1428]MCT2180063.1 LLM class flavin-dependent oxidoreductase [Kocuria sp. p3-SID1433]